MKALILTMTSAFLVLITVLAITNLQLLMELGAIQLPGLEINLALMLFYTLVALAMSGGLYVLWADAKESRDEIRKHQQAVLKLDARVQFQKNTPPGIQMQTKWNPKRQRT